MKVVTGSLLVGIACLSLSAPVHAVTGMSVEFGNGDGADMARIGLQWDLNKQWFKGDNRHLGSYVDLSLGHWRRGNEMPGQNDNITEIGLTPTLRIQQNDFKGLYFEAAAGIHLLSRTSLGPKRFSTQFQFGNHLGIGYRFGAKSAFDLGYRYQHLSNAGIKTPNNGINFNQIRLQYHF